MMSKRKFSLWSALLLCVALTGCSATHTAIKKRNLDVQTKMSETVFLEPVTKSKRTIYIDVKNTTDKQFDIENQIIQAISNHGYKVTDDPARATYMLQASILQVGKSDLREASSALDAGFGGTLMAGAGAAALGTNARDTLGAGLLGAAAGLIGDALVDDVVYTMITDLQIRERPLKGEKVVQTQAADLKQGSSTRTKQHISGGNVNWKTYRSRVVSTANKMNLKFEEAEPELITGLVRSISGIF